MKKCAAVLASCAMGSALGQGQVTPVNVTVTAEGFPDTVREFSVFAPSNLPPGLKPAIITIHG
jgi:hypothetical protein